MPGLNVRVDHVGVDRVRFARAANGGTGGGVRYAIGLAAALAAVLLAPVPARADENPPTITSSGFGDHRLNIAWRGPDQYDVFNIRYAEGVLGTSFDRQVQTGGGTGGQLSIRPDSPGTWVFVVEGCRHGVFKSDCSKWSAQTSVVAPTEPPPQSQTMTWPAMAAGDCHMQNAKVTFNSYGDAQFSAQVKTDHTHSGDVWHATVTGLNAAKQTLVAPKTFDSMTMDDDHGWYNWTQSFGFADAEYSKIVSWHMDHTC